MIQKTPRIIICIILISHNLLIAQKSGFQAGARSEAMGHASVAISDQWAVFNNIGALAGDKDFSIGFSYKSQFDIEGFNTAAICVNIPAGSLTIGAGATSFGDNIFSEQKASIGASHQISFVSLGLNFNYLQYNVIDYGSNSALVVEMGGMVNISSTVRLALNFFNINSARISKNGKGTAPTILRCGLSFRPDEKLAACLEVEKETYFDLNMKAGLEYAIIEQLFIRTGFSTLPRRGHFGLGFKNDRFDIDFALTDHQLTGASQHLAVNYKIGERK